MRAAEILLGSETVSRLTTERAIEQIINNAISHTRKELAAMLSVQEDATDAFERIVRLESTQLELHTAAVAYLAGLGQQLGTDFYQYWLHKHQLPEQFFLRPRSRMLANAITSGISILLTEEMYRDTSWGERVTNLMDKNYLPQYRFADTSMAVLGKRYE